MDFDLDQMRWSNGGNRAALTALARPPIRPGGIHLPPLREHERLVTFLKLSEPVRNFRFVGINVAKLSFSGGAPRKDFGSVHISEDVYPYLALPASTGTELRATLTKLEKAGSWFVGHDVFADYAKLPPSVAPTIEKLIEKSISTMLFATKRGAPRPYPLSALMRDNARRSPSPTSIEKLFHGTQERVELVGQRWARELDGEPHETSRLDSEIRQVNLAEELLRNYAEVQAQRELLGWWLTSERFRISQIQRDGQVKPEWFDTTPADLVELTGVGQQPQVTAAEFREWIGPEISHEFARSFESSA